MTDKQAYSRAKKTFTRNLTNDPFFAQPHIARQGHSYQVGYLVSVAGIVMFSVKGSGDNWYANAHRKVITKPDGTPVTPEEVAKRLE